MKAEPRSSRRKSSKGKNKSKKAINSANGDYGDDQQQVLNDDSGADEEQYQEVAGYVKKPPKKDLKKKPQGAKLSAKRVIKEDEGKLDLEVFLIANI